MWRWVSRMSIRPRSGGSCAPSRRTPVPASSTSTVPSSPRTSMLGGIAAIARGLRPGRGDRAAGAEQGDAHGQLDLPEQRGGAEELALEPEDRDRRDLDLPAHAVHPLDVETLVGRSLFRERDHQREVLRRYRPPLIVDRREGRRPYLCRHGAGLFEALAQNRLGRLVVEQKITLGVDQEQRHAQIAGELPHQDDLDRQGHLPLPWRAAIVRPIAPLRNLEEGRPDGAQLAADARASRLPLASAEGWPGRWSVPAPGDRPSAGRPRPLSSARAHRSRAAAAEPGHAHDQWISQNSAAAPRNSPWRPMIGIDATSICRRTPFMPWRKKRL